MTLDERKEKAEEIIGVPIEWEGDRGYYHCPLSNLHTTPTGRRDTLVYLEGVPTSYCFHQNCQSFHQTANIALRSELDERKPEEKRADKQARKAKASAHNEALEIRAQRKEIYENYAWQSIFENPETSGGSYSTFLGLWNPSDIIWVGEVYNTGVHKGRGHFRKPGEWGDLDLRYNHFTTASVWGPGVVDRIGSNVERTPFLIVEFDNLDKDKEENKRKGAALLNYLRSRIPLKMVVDSGNKSLHGWFINDNIPEQTRFLLRSLGADINTMRPSQPVRLPGAIRENGNVQSILWIQT